MAAARWRKPGRDTAGKNPKFLLQENRNSFARLVQSSENKGFPINSDSHSFNLFQ